VSFKVYIPARYGSVRLPGKLLETVGDWPLIRYSYEQAKKSSAEQVIIATDDDRIGLVSQQFGALVSITASEHDSGTDRVCEAVVLRKERDDVIIVNVQADEPLIPSSVIDQVAHELAQSDADIVTVCEPLSGLEELLDASVVKVVRDSARKALYFSRAQIPSAREKSNYLEEIPHAYKRHVGIYAYRASYLKTFVTALKSEYEKIERLEQLRALSRGDTILVVDAIHPCGIGVDTKKDLEQFRKMIEKP
jgi:3-deoxy-manno-octulosonate cytidylyltransferase (CMP-KDO synthetase)